MNSDRIEKEIVIHAPRSRVWQALTDAEKFGQWFGVKLNGSFAPGEPIRGQVTNKGYEHLPFEFTVERMEPEHLFSWRWHPYAIDLTIDYSGEPTTLVVFELEEVADGTRLTVVESGFNALPAARYPAAFRSNTGGWEAQMTRIERYVVETT